MSDLIRNTQKAIVKSDGDTAKAVGGGMVVAGGSTIAVSMLAAFLPFGPLFWGLAFGLFGLFLMLK